MSLYSHIVETILEGKLPETERLAAARKLLEQTAFVLSARSGDTIGSWSVYCERHGRHGVRLVIYNAEGREVDLSTLPAPQPKPEPPQRVAKPAWRNRR